MKHPETEWIWSSRTDISGPIHPWQWNLKKFFENHRGSGAARFFNKPSRRGSGAVAFFYKPSRRGSFFFLTPRRGSGSSSAAMDISVTYVSDINFYFPRGVFCIKQLYIIFIKYKYIVILRRKKDFTISKLISLSIPIVVVKHLHIHLYIVLIE